MKTLKLALTIAIASIGFVSCDKKEEPIDVSKRAYLYDRAWNLIEHRHTINADDEFPVYTDVLATTSPCKYDDFYFFDTKTSGVYSDYFVRCDASLPEHTPIFLDISEDDQIISVYSNPDDINASLLIYGHMKTPHIDTFTVENRYWSEDTETFQLDFKKFVVTYPTDI